MALNYFDIMAQAAIRIGEGGSLAGSSPASIEANYTGFNPTKIDSAAFPFSAQRDALLLAEEKIAQVVAAVKNHPLRAFLRGVSDPLAFPRAVVPTDDAAGDPIIGIPGAIYDSVDQTILTPRKIESLNRLNRLRTGNALVGGYYHYAIEGSVVTHTRPNTIIVEVCKYNRSTQKALAQAGGAALFPDSLEEMYVCGEISYLFRADETPETCKQYVAYFTEGLKMLEAGEIPQQ